MRFPAILFASPPPKPRDAWPISSARTCGHPVLVLDEVNYQPLARAEADLVFQAISKRYEKGSIIPTSNKTFSGWTKTFTDPRLCTAIADRLTFNGTIIETGTDSYRLASTRARVEEPATAV